MNSEIVENTLLVNLCSSANINKESHYVEVDYGEGLFATCVFIPKDICPYPEERLHDCYNAADTSDYADKNDMNFYGYIVTAKEYVSIFVLPHPANSINIEAYEQNKLSN